MTTPGTTGDVNAENKPTPGTDDEPAVNSELIPDPADLQEGKDRPDRPTAPGATKAGQPDRGYAGRE